MPSLPRGYEPRVTVLRVSRRVALAAALQALGAALSVGAAHADDPREVFGLGQGPARTPGAAPPECAEGRAVGCVTATDPLAERSPSALTTWLGRDDLLALPIGDARHDAVAHFAAGTGRDEGGVLFGGATGLENRWTIEGAPADSIRTGGVDTRLPLAFLEGLTITAGGFSARDRTSTGGTVDARLIRGTATHRVIAHAWGTLTTEATPRPVAAGSYQVQRATANRAPDTSLALVATGPLPRLAGGATWYAAGIAPSLEPVRYRWRAARIVDRDGDSLPDGAPGPLVTVPIGTTDVTAYDYLIPALARVGWDRGAHRLELSLVGHAARDGVFLTNATTDSAIERSVLTGDAIATWHGRWEHTRARVQLAWHRSARMDAPRAAASAAPQLLSAFVPGDLPVDPVLAAACTDATDPGLDPEPTIVNCPVPFGFFASGGAGLLVDQTADRPSATAEVAHRIGAHVLRVGGTFEDSRLVSTSRYTGERLVRSLFPGHEDTVRFFDGACTAIPGEPCNYLDAQQLRYRTRYAAAYLEDTFQLSPAIRADLGVRWELMEVGTLLQFDAQFAPRLGLAWDFLGGGRSRAWASMGRSYLYLPSGLGQTITARNRTVRDITGVLGDARIIEFGHPVPIADGIDSGAQDEATAGIEVGQPGLARATAWVQGRTLRRGLETVSFDPAAFTVNFDNPGRNGQPPAQRDTFVAAAEILVTPTPQTAVRASYSYTQVRGNWTGPFDPRQGSTVYAGSDFDLLATNQAGRLPTDGGHRAFVEARGQRALGRIELGLATRFTVGSGRPRSVLGDSDLGLIYLLPRGDAGRGPMISQVDLRLAARWRSTQLTLDLFNVFDRDVATNLDELYATTGTLRPIADGTAEDLVFLKYEGGGNARRRTAFRLPTAYQPPFGITLGLHRAF